MEKAIIKSFPNKESSLQLRIIAKRTNELLHGRSNSETIGKRIAKMEKKDQYLIKKSKGIYALNPICDFDIGDGEPLPFETKSSEISIERREKHTLELKPVIEKWIKNFPCPPHLEDTYQKNTYRGFSASIKVCEEHLLFSDLLNHLPESGFEVSDRWERYKNVIGELEKIEDHLMEMIEQNISQIFDKLPIKFVNNSYLESDYQCRIPRLAFDFALEEYTFEIRYSHAVKKARDDPEAYRIYNDLESSISNHAIIDFLPLVEKGESIIWGDDFTGPHLLRIPKKDKDILMNGMDRALAAISDPSTEISNGIIEIADRLKRLDQEREYMLKELQSSLYCQCFSGDCRYLGGKSS